MLNWTAKTYKGWETWSLSNKWITLLLAPQLGGRIIQIEMGNYEFLFTNPSLYGKEPNPASNNTSEWKNYGGEKIWPAPQGWDSPEQWPGPPDRIIDGGTYSFKQTCSNKQYYSGAKLTSQFDPYTGLISDREILISRNSSEILIKASFFNRSNRSVNWSIWPVCQMDASNFEATDYQIICPLNPESKYQKGYKVMHGLANSPQFILESKNLLSVHYQYLVGKIGMDTLSNWIAYLNRSNGKVLLLKHQPEKGSLYPENTSVQVWTQGKGLIYSRNMIREFPDNKNLVPPYVELELLSPLKEIRPGEKVCYNYRILTSTILVNSTINSVSEHAIVVQTLSREENNKGVLISASYGIFAMGKIKIKKKDFSGKGCERLLFETEVNPNKPVNIKFPYTPEKEDKSSTLIITELHDLEGLLIDEIDRMQI